MNSLWHAFKLKFFKSGSPPLLYIGINVLIFFIVSIATIICFYANNGGIVQEFISKYFAFPSFSGLWISRFYTLITYQFFHASFLHILFNMLWLYWIGQLFLDFVKPRQFHFVYLGGGILGAVFFALMFNTIPMFKSSATDATLVGASAAVMSIFTALATLVPNYHIRLLFVGEVKIKYLLFVYIFLDILGTSSFNAGGSFSHLGGVIFGFAYIKILQNGTDLSAIFKKKPKLKVVKNENPQRAKNVINQKEIDAILDKISKTGYDKLSKTEKDTLFKASKN